MPKYLLEIGLKGDTIEHDKNVEARSLDEAYEIANGWAIEEYCIVHATPVDNAGKLAAEFEDLIGSVRASMRSLSRNMNGQLTDPARADRFLRAMKRSIGTAFRHAIEDSESDD